MLYTVGRAVWSSSRTNQSLEGRTAKFLSMQQFAEDSWIIVKNGASLEAQALNRNLRNSNNYEPPLEPAATTLTYLLVVLKWVAKWIVSSPCWAFRIYHLLVSKALTKTKWKNVNDFVATAREARLLKNIWKRCILIIPALIGFKPIVVGYIVELKRHKALAGVLSYGYKKNRYLGVDDPSAISEPLSSGTSFGYVFSYEEDSGFVSMKTVCLAAVIVAAFLLLFSLIPLLIISFGRLRPLRTRNKCAVPQPQEGSDSVASERASSSNFVIPYLPCVYQWQCKAFYSNIEWQRCTFPC